MKLTFLLIIGAFLTAGATGFAQNVTLDGSNVSLRNVFNEIEKQTGYVFLYTSKVISTSKPVSISVNALPLETVLADVFRKQPLKYRISGRSIFISQKTASEETAAEAGLKDEFPVAIDVRGTVKDESGSPLSGVTVTVKGTTVATATSANGDWALKQIDEKSILIFTSIGYEQQSFAVGNRQVINVVMQQVVDEQNEVVVVGYGTASKKDLTGAVSSITREELTKTPNVNFDASLTGRMPGVQVVKANGAPGAIASVRVRGGASAIGTNEPLYVIDGIPVEIGDGFGNAAYQSDALNKLPFLASLNPQDIERIDILKDASSAAIYGSRAANGVVMITTKRGSRSVQPRVTAGFYSQFDQFANMNNVKMLNADQYHQFVRTAYENAGATLPATHIAYPNANTDWVDVTTRTAVSNNVYLNIGGGTRDGSTLYSLSGGLAKQDGVLRHSAFERKNLKANIETSLFGRLRFGTNINVSETYSSGAQVASFAGILRYRPDVPVLDVNGRPGAAPDSVLSNPLARVQQPSNLKNQVLLSSFFGELNILRGLKLRSVINVTLNKGEKESYTPSTDPFEIRNGRKGSRTDFNNTSTVTVFENTLTFDRRFDDHALNVLGGASFTKVNSEFMEISSNGFQDDEVLNNLGSAGSISGYNSGGGVSGLASYFIRSNYGLKDKYFLTFTGRADHSTKFGPRNRWGFFPSGAVAWKILNENFMQSVEQLDELKLRVSYGKTGSANFSDFQYATFFGSGSFYNGFNGVLANTIPNAAIRWESTYQFDAALDFALLKNRIFGSVGYFRKTTKDMILNAPIIRESGGRTQYSNVGDFLNKGWEFQIGGDIVKNVNFTYTTDINLTQYRNKVLALNGGSYLTLQEGQPMGVFTGYRVAGIFQSQKEMTT